ncbi:unnamed protein product [Rotaria magnacalcarata]|uniref:BED-type domain-containing protein n=1 Tax=Rotaria magnacalcarata TaxID=392030 RepID=A0A815X3D0_9BILA|nr:unnamed protein product [Rotaria magnacalcarata]CAF1552068.1 unnamed protein product [Rotaria magnacalcarata]CAF1929549.1 unnamed protein product [Rotaria magnacalcarata]CAF2042932.1 unnamed protein product [Rotaria magnacalcarata]CAF2122025.1 unnamed protein product [Rotaria magnacalcarata]
MAREQLKKFFDFFSLENNRVRGHCRLCNQDYKDKAGICSNFLKHLRRKHFSDYERTFKKHDEGLSEEGIIASDGQSTTELSSNKTKQVLINSTITKNLIIKCNLPLNIVENHAFRDFIKECNAKWDPVSSKHIKLNVIPQFKEKVNKIIYETLSSARHVTLTIDGWSDRRCKSFLGITCHFINSKMQPESYLIDFVRLKSHTAENIYHTTELILGHFNIKEKIYKIVTDNASCMKKAYQFGLAVDDEVDDNVPEVPLLSSTSTILSEYDEDIDVNNFQFIDIPSNDENTNDYYDPSDVRLSCFAHTLQLCIRDGLKNAPYVSKVLGKCQAVSKFSHKSSKMADLLEQLNKSISKMNLTRWNSEYLLVKSIHSIDKSELDLLTSMMSKPIMFSNNDLIILEEIILILAPFHEISIKCQAETAATVSLVVPSIVHLISHLRDIKEDLAFSSKLAGQLQESIKKRFSGIINRLHLNKVAENDPYGDRLYIIAAVLDPCFKFYWIRDLQLPIQSENHLKQSIIELIIVEMQQYVTLSSSKANTTALSLTTTSITSTSKVKRRKLFNYDDNNTDDSNESTILDPTVELNAYLNDPVRTQFSDYWFHSQLNILKTVVIRLFTVQASSAPIERAFSHAGLILSSRRTNMNENLFRDLVFLRVNQKLL